MKTDLKEAYEQDDHEALVMHYSKAKGVPEHTVWDREDWQDMVYDWAASEIAE